MVVDNARIYHVMLLKPLLRTFLKSLVEPIQKNLSYDTQLYKQYFP